MADRLDEWQCLLHAAAAAAAELNLSHHAELWCHGQNKHIQWCINMQYCYSYTVQGGGELGHLSLVERHRGVASYKSVKGIRDFRDYRGSTYV